MFSDNQLSVVAVMQLRERSRLANNSKATQASKFLVSLHILLPVCLGGIIYTVWRSPHLLVFRWYSRLGLTASVNMMRLHSAHLRHCMPAWVLYSLPDALWVYSFTALLAFLWSEERSGFSPYCWQALPVLLATGGELGQILRIVP